MSEGTASSEIPTASGPVAARPVIVVHYDEIGVKGRNRRHFEHVLKVNIKEALKGTGGAQVRNHPGRILVFPNEDATSRTIFARLARIPGVRYVLLGLKTEPAYEAIVEALVAQLPDSGVTTFGVRVKRRDKSFALTSSELEARLGEEVLKRRPWQVDLKRPDLWIRVEVPGGLVLVCVERLDGSGGLPTGSSGAGVALLSGGIDSPVAAHLMMARGLRLSFIHFHSAPFTNRESQEKVKELARLLCQYQPVLHLTMVPFAEPIQRAIIEHTPAPYRVLLYRRFMLRLAIKMAAARKASCIVTGEALGQVASQTIENMTAVQAVSSLPILRPLVGLGKPAIIEKAQELGTYEISIRPHDDCCSYLMPDEPATRSWSDELDAAEAPLDVESLIEETWERRSEERLRLKEVS